MLELKHITKIYNPQKGNKVMALNDVSFQLPNKGLIFLLGKSGSGKSTLLNLLGGLDTPTSGEIIINGKSQNDFKEKDFDAYRNSIIGFIFQDFNILENYNVYENISLAEHLQERAISNEQIDLLLDKLNLKNLGNRKTNELSGGQKQRVALARALIKKPQIILADEPTGNLDQKSSAEIFQLLKEISSQTLVIVVSHDRDSAFLYGDRIIELKDGTIINDTNPLQTIESYEQIEFKKAVLPFSYTIQMAFRNLKVKPFRLILTIFIMAFAFILMGFSMNCLLFHSNSLMIETMKDNHEFIYDIQKYNQDGNLELTEEDLTKYSNITHAVLNKGYELIDNERNLFFELDTSSQISSVFYGSNSLRLHFIELEDTNIIPKVIGNLPSLENEMVIHKFLANLMIQYGVKDTNNEIYKPENIETLVTEHHPIELGDNTIYIVGVVDDDDSLYQSSFEKGNFINNQIKAFYDSDYKSLSNYVYVKGFTNSVILNENKNTILNKFHLKYENQTDSNIFSVDKEIEYITEDGIKNTDHISKDNVILSVEYLNKIDSSFHEQYSNFLQNNYTKEDLINFIIEYLKTNDLMTKNVSLNIDNRSFSSVEELKIMGLSLQSNYISDDYIQENKVSFKKLTMVRIYDDNEQNLNHVLNTISFKSFYVPLNSSMDIIKNRYSSYVSNISETYESLDIIIFFLSFAFFIFTIVLLINFIGNSIVNSKKEIGILRSLGTSNKDIIKIFSCESIMIGILSWITSIIGYTFIVNALNQWYTSKYFFQIDLVVFHPFVPLGMFLFTIFTSFVITLLLIRNITKINPIDAINKK